MHARYAWSQSGQATPLHATEHDVHRWVQASPQSAPGARSGDFSGAAADAAEEAAGAGGCADAILGGGAKALVGEGPPAWSANVSELAEETSSDGRESDASAA